MYIVVMIISIITNIITSITNLWNSLLKNWVTNKIGMGKRDRYSITWGGKKITGINRIGNFSMARDIVDITCYGSYCRSFAPGLIGELSFVLCLDRTSEFAMDLTNDFILGTHNTLEITFPSQKEKDKENMQGSVSGVAVEAFIRKLDIIFEGEEIIQYSFQPVTNPKLLSG